jgi:hypothetical protein
VWVLIATLLIFRFCSALASQDIGEGDILINAMIRWVAGMVVWSTKVEPVLREGPVLGGVVAGYLQCGNCMDAFKLCEIVELIRIILTLLAFSVISVLSIHVVCIGCSHGAKGGIYIVLIRALRMIPRELEPIPLLACPQLMVGS